MPIMCPLTGCKEKPGMCMHEKAMLGLIIIIIAAVVAIKLL